MALEKGFAFSIACQGALTQTQVYSLPNSTQRAKPQMSIENKPLKQRAHQALGDESLQKALSVIADGFVNKRARALDAFPGFHNLSDEAVEIKNHTLKHLSEYLEMFEHNLKQAGGQLHYATDGQAARRIITKLCRDEGAKRIAKGKSMVGEEIDLREHLDEEGFDVVETDLGEYLIQIRDEKPSHIIAPAVHLTRDQIRKDFLVKHHQLAENRRLDSPEDFVREARAILRQAFITADVGITGANILVAETGSLAIVTNEGNGDLVSSLPKTHIVITSFDKLVPTMEDAFVILRLLARSATGQAMSTYTSFFTGAKRSNDRDGPQNLHVIILDNGRSELLGSRFREMLRCIRCGACLNHCPVYQNVGGHAYGSVYPGPMGAVLSPQFMGSSAAALPFASSFCGRCNEVCPMQIPLTKLMRFWREEAAKQQSGFEKLAMRAWSTLAKRPALYRLALKTGLPLLSLITHRPSLARYLPGLKAWSRHRTPPKLAARSFQDQYKHRQNRAEKMLEGEQR